MSAFMVDRSIDDYRHGVTRLTVPEEPRGDMVTLFDPDYAFANFPVEERYDDGAVRLGPFIGKPVYPPGYGLVGG